MHWRVLNITRSKWILRGKSFWLWLVSIVSHRQWDFENNFVVCSCWAYRNYQISKMLNFCSWVGYFWCSFRICFRNFAKLCRKYSEANDDRVGTVLIPKFLFSGHVFLFSGFTQLWEVQSHSAASKPFQQFPFWSPQRNRFQSWKSETGD